jgi:hypothetical protein
MSCTGHDSRPSAPLEEQPVPFAAGGSSCHGEFIAFTGFENYNGGIERGIVNLRSTIWCNPSLVYAYYIEFKSPQSTVWQTLDVTIPATRHENPHEYRYNFDAAALFMEIGNEGFCEFRIKELFNDASVVYSPAITLFVHPI